MKKLCRLFLLSGMLVCAAACGASAASIVNLDTAPWDVRIHTGGQVREVRIEPGQTWHGFGYPLRAEIQGHEQMLESDADYAIWKGGVLTLQRRGAHSRLDGGS